MTNISDVPKAIRTQAQYVLLGMRVMDQSVLPKSYNSKEPYLKPDMIYIHDRRQERMLKITQEIEMEHWAYEKTKTITAYWRLINNDNDDSM